MTDLQETLQQRLLVCAALVIQSLADVHAGLFDQGTEQAVGVSHVAGQVDHPDQPPREWIADRGADASQLGQPLSEVFGAHHLDSGADLRDRAQTVGADGVFGIDETLGGVHPVELAH